MNGCINVCQNITQHNAVDYVTSNVARPQTINYKQQVFTTPTAIAEQTHRLFSIHCKQLQNKPHFVIGFVTTYWLLLSASAQFSQYNF